jgi:putative ABC transport system permease protein
MRWFKNSSAAYQVVTALPMRTALLGLLVAVSSALTLAAVAIEQGVAAKANEAAVNRGVDLVVVYGGGRLVPGKGSMTSTLTEEDVAALQSQMRGVGAILPTHRENEVPASCAGKSGVFKVFGVTPPWFEVRDFPAERGETLDQNDLDTNSRVAVIGQTVARELFGDQDPVGQEIVVNQVPFRVKGVLVVRGASPAEGDRDARIVIPITTFASRLYNRRVHLGQIVIQVPNPTQENCHRVAEACRAILRRQHQLGPDQPDDFVLRTPETIAEESRGISRSVFNLLFGLAAVLALVAAAVLILVIHQAIRSRRGEIGIRRALGAEPRDILLQVWSEGVLISLAGGALGVLLGGAATWGLARWRDLPFQFNAVALLAPLGVVLLTALAGLIPAQGAARLDPAEALRPTA